jgi:hypothetical protein
MGFHSCKHPDCGFWLPVGYPLPVCPWHVARGGLLGISAATAIASLISGGYILKLNQAYREARHEAEVRAGQAAWRELKRKYRQKKLEGAEHALYAHRHSAATGTRGRPD